MTDLFIHKAAKGSASARGFTIVELMITVTVAAVLLALALPSFRETIVSSNVTETTNQLIGDLNLARSEAVRRGTLVAVISTSGTNNWSGGWRVETDGDFLANGTFAWPITAATKDVLLRTNPGVNAANSYAVKTAFAGIGCVGPATTPAVGMVIFNAQGTQPCNVSKFHINVCRPDSQPAKSKWITVDTSGMTKSQTNTAASPAPAC
jgi:type IV fimbrial biogenesis protein FimT